MTNKNREELFFQETLSIFDIWNNDKKCGELYYFVGNNLSKDDVEEKKKEFLTETSKEEGVVVYTSYDKKKDEYYIDYYMEGSFDEREIISKEEADEMEVGTFATMGIDELNNYSDFFDAYELRYKLEDIIKNFD